MIDFKQKIEETDEELMESKNRYEEEKILANLKKKRKLKNYLIAIFAIVFILSGKIIMSSHGVSEWLTNNPFWERVVHLTENDDKLIAGEKEDRINILLLGIGGANHDGGYLADTIMLASIKPSTKQIALISIPRDLSLPNRDGRWQKINSIHAYAEARESGTGGDAMIDLISFNLNMPIHYYVRLDFQGFIKVIDELGGIEVSVENTLNDYRYPLMGQEDNPDYYARFEHLSIEKGLQKMDGSLALKYARSRYAAGIEGSDFARARRQQLILSAVKEKLLSKNNLLKPMMVSRVISELNRNIKTNLDIWEMLKLWNDYKGVNKNEIISQVFDDGPGGLLMATRGEDGAYILIPQTGNFKEIEEKIVSIFGEVEIAEQDKSSETKNEVVVEVEKVDKDIKVTVLNGTWISGLAAQNALKLQEYGFKINDTANAPTRAYENSVIYDLSYGKKLKALEILKAVSKAKIAYDAPSWLEVYKNKAEQSDFILIVGAEIE
jgi:polyisoprenyl-teichoic acid--peptidoglycan teichoic acid transferase